MRYSTIHHDVREKFNITIGTYMVIDSIHQLTLTSKRNCSNSEIARFIGVDEKTVREGKRIGILKNLLIQKPEFGWTTSQEWADAVTLASGKFRTSRENPEKTRENPEHTIINNNKEVNTVESEIRVVSDSEEEPKEPSHLESYRRMNVWLRGLTGAPIKYEAKQFKWLKVARESGYGPERLKHHAEKMWDSSFWKATGMDWKNVVEDLDKHHE